MNINKKNTWPILGEAQLGQFLSKSIKASRVGGAYIFAGPDNLGKTTVAKYFAKVLLCNNKQKTADFVNACGLCASCKRFEQGEASEDLADTQAELGEAHGDFFVLKKESDKKNISIEQIRDFIRLLNLSSFSGGFKVGVIKHADTLSISAANALLKTLEEPKQNTVIILVAKDADELPSTISSRSQILQFKPVKTELIYDYLVEEKKVLREKARDIARLAQGRPALALKFIENQDFYDYYNKQVEAILKMQVSDLNGRFAVIDDVLDKKLKGQEAVRQAQRVIEIWQGVIRDYILLTLGLNSRLQHVYVQDSIKQLRQAHTLKELADLSKSLNSAIKYLEANVSPRLVFERIALSI